MPLLCMDDKVILLGCVILKLADQYCHCLSLKRNVSTQNLCNKAANYYLLKGHISNQGSTLVGQNKNVRHNSTLNFIFDSKFGLHKIKQEAACNQVMIMLMVHLCEI